ncbi:MAG: hypothetical protein ABIL68_13185 [bacterium]
MAVTTRKIERENSQAVWDPFLPEIQSDVSNGWIPIIKALEDEKWGFAFCDYKMILPYTVESANTIVFYEQNLQLIVSDFGDTIQEEVKGLQIKNKNVIRLLDEWLADESGYDEKIWPIVKKDIEENRSSYRELFND